MSAIPIEAFPPLIVLMLKTAQDELEAHTDHNVSCRVCRCAYPCERAELAAMALGAFGSMVTLLLC